MIKQLKEYLSKQSFSIALGISFLYALIGTSISVIRFWQYDTFYYDFGIFDQAIWKVSQFSLPIIDHIAIGEKIIFADHFSPSIFLLSPLFWIFPYSEILLIIQAFAVAMSGLILFLIGKHLLKANLPAVGIMCCYFLFVGLQNAVITDFHEVTLATLFFMLTYLCIVKLKKPWFFLFFILLLGAKETMFLVGIGISITIWFLQPAWKKTALLSSIIALFWGFISIKFIIPLFSAGTYMYNAPIPINPIVITSAFFDSPIKQHTIFFSFFSFGFLPLINPAFWFLLFQDFLTRFYQPEWTTRWGLGLHYSAILAATMGVSSVYSIRMLQRYLKPLYIHILIIVLIFNSLFIYRFLLHGPFALAYNPAFYVHIKDFSFLDDAIKKIPKTASIMTQNNLATHFTHQKAWMLISDAKKYPIEYYTLKNPEYILIDNRPGQNPNNFFGISDINLLIQHIRADKNYQEIYTQDALSIFKKKNN